MVGRSDDDFDDDWSDGDEDGFDDFEETAFDPVDENPAPAKKGSPLLIMGGALFAISVIAGYLAKDIIMPSEPAMTPATINASAVTDPDPLAMQAQAPAHTTNENVALDDYSAEKISDLISDDDFTGTDDGQNDDPFDDFDSGMPDTNNLEANSLAVPFDSPNTGDPDDETIVSIETLSLNDLDPPQQPVIEAPENNNAPQDNVSADNILSNFAADNGPVGTAAVPVTAEADLPPASPPETVQAGNSDSAPTAQDADAQAKLLMAETEIENLNNQLSALNNKIAKLENELADARKATPQPAAAAPSAPAPKVTKTVKKQPPAPKPRNWVLRGANATEATVSEPGSNELLTLNVGDMIPGYGRIQTIHWLPETGWEVITTGGKLSQ